MELASTSEPPPGFVRVSADGRRFEISGTGQPFFFCGCNVYYLMVLAISTFLKLFSRRCSKA